MDYTCANCKNRGCWDCEDYNWGHWDTKHCEDNFELDPNTLSKEERDTLLKLASLLMLSEVKQMKNHEYIRKTSVKKLAELLVSSEEVNEGDEGMDGDWVDYYVTHYICPDGVYAYDYEDAVLHTIDWLNSNYKGKAE